MRLNLILCGKNNEKWIDEATAIYFKRLARYVKFELTILPDIKTKLPILDLKNKEAKQILNCIDKSDLLILLDENGKEFSSVNFAKEIQKTLSSGKKNAHFVIGGPYGFSEEIYLRADKKISLSKMTFSHQVIRVIFAEQLYRAFTILNNEPYHHS